MQQATKTTEPFTKFINSKKFNSDFGKASLNVLDACKSGGIFVDQFGRTIDVGAGIDLINHIAVEKKWKPLTRKTFIQCFAAAEHRIASSGIIACFALAQMFVTKTHIDILEISKKSKYARKNNVEELLTALLDEMCADLLLDIVDHVGTSGRINILKGSKTRCALEVRASHHFHFGIDPAFISQELKRDYGMILLVDGAVEKIGEIDQVLQYCHENKATLFLIARKFGNEVISTLNLNFQQRMLDVIPIKVSDKISHLNVFSDLAVTTLSSVIGERSGLLAANVVPDELKIISGVKCSHNAFSYAAIDAAARGIEKRIRDLDERCNREHVYGLMSEDDIGELLIKRIETLTSSGATLWLPANCMKTGLYSHVNAKFRFGTGLLDSLCKTGMIEISDEIEKMFGNLGVSFLPASILINALSVADGVLSSIQSAGGCVVVEQVDEYPRNW